MDLIKLKQIAFDEMSEYIHWSGEINGKYYHGERVAKIGLTLRKYILPNDESHDDIISVAGWFHDCVHGIENHALAGAERAKTILAEHCTEYEMNTIYEIMYKHDDRYSNRDSFPVYAKIQQDADLLDHFGSFDIWTQFIYASHKGRNVIETIEHMKEWVETISEKYEEQLNFDISKKIYKDKIEFHRYFFERFNIEGTGGIWNEEVIMRN